MFVFLQRGAIIQFSRYFYHIDTFLLDKYLQLRRRRKCRQKYKVLVVELLPFYRTKPEKERRYGSCFLHEFLK